MNKQEAIEKIEKEKSNLNAWEDLTRNRALDDALAIVRKLDEPEKPVLSKAEAEWLERVKKVYVRQTDRLHIITRQGWGYDFEVTMRNKEYILSYKPYERTGEDTDLVKRRLVNAVIYGYTVKKEKLYTAKLKSTGEYLHYDIETAKIHHFFAYGNTAKNSKHYHFTEDTLLKYNAWGNDAYDVNEVEE